MRFSSRRNLAAAVLLAVAPAAFAAGGTGTCTASGTCAHRAPGAQSVRVPRPLATMVNLGVFHIRKRFATPVPGLSGYLLDQHGHYSIVYGIGDYVLAGALISPAGANLTAVYNHKYAPKPKYADVVAALKKGGALVSMGDPKAGKVLYVFEDPNCIFCHKLSLALAPYIKAGTLRVEIAPVAFVHPDSMGKAAAILSAKDPGRAWVDNERKFDTATEEGGYPAQAHPDRKLVAAIRHNMKLMSQAGFGGTPGILYRDARGHWAGVGGFPGNAWIIRHLGPAPHPAGR